MNMQIDWKRLSTTTGYKSLKAAYINDVKKKWRNKNEAYKKFQFVINRAKHTANANGSDIETVLNEWESKRDYWWINYYQDARQKKKHSNSLKPLGINGMRKHYKKQHYLGSKTLVKHRVNDYIKSIQKSNSKKIKQRWSMLKKKHHKRICKLVT